MTKPVVLWAERAACSGCSVSFLDNHGAVDDILERIDLKYHTLITDGRTIPDHIDLAIIEGGVAITDKQIEFVRCIRNRSDIVVAMGACAETGGVLNYAEGNQMPMPELDAYLPLHDLIEVDYVMPGCPPAPEAIAKFFDAYLRKDWTYLAPYHTIKGKSEGKIRDIVKMGLCVSCGLCGATCPTNAIRFVEGKPVIRDERCIICGECYFQCPRSFLRLEERDTSAQNGSIGSYIEIYQMRTTDSALRRAAQSGGIVTALFSYALDNNYIDGVIAAKKSEESVWMGDPYIATTTDELKATSGTKYSVCPTLNYLRDAVTTYGLGKLGIVGLPCQHEALKKLDDYPLGLRHISEKIALKIGLFCTSNFRYNAMTKMVEEVGGVRPEDISKIDIGAGSFNIDALTGELIKIPLDVVHNYEQESCKICPDFTSEYADISVGSIGADEHWSTVIVRSERGKEIIDGAVENGLIETRTLSEKALNLVKKIASSKRKKGASYIATREEYGLLVPFRYVETDESS
jgi:coenzyme F420 hydrogenase subunit beta